MPWVTINVLAGHGEDKKMALHANVAKAVYETLDIPPDWVKIQIVEMQEKDHSIGGIQINNLPK